MTEAAALQKFWSGFGLAAYPSNSVPKDTKFPWLTYETRSGFFGDTPVSVSVSLWFLTDSEKIPNDKAKEIGQAIGSGGIQIPTDDGTIWIKRGSPWSIPLTDENDPAIKRRQLNVSLEFFTE